MVEEVCVVVCMDVGTHVGDVICPFGWFSDTVTDDAIVLLIHMHFVCRPIGFSCDFVEIVASYEYIRSSLH